MEREAVYKLLRAQGALTIDMSENFVRGNPEVLYAENDAVYMIHDSGVYLLWAKDRQAAERALAAYPEPARTCVAHGMEAYHFYIEKYDLHDDDGLCLQYCYSKKEKLPVSGQCEIRQMTVDDLPFVMEHYKLVDFPDYIRGRLESGVVWGAYIDGKCAGFIGGHKEGSIGMLEVLPEFRRRGIGTDLENFQMNRFIDMGFTPYGQVYLDNAESHALQKKTGLEVSTDIICWVDGEKRD